MSSIRPEQLDSYMRASESSQERVVWYSVQSEPFEIRGFGWQESLTCFKRLPLQPAQAIPAAVDQLAYCPAGGSVHFQTDSPYVMIRAKLSGPSNMYHMPSTGQSGFDCYIAPVGEPQRYIGTTRLSRDSDALQHKFYQLEPKLREVTIHLPLYQGVESIEIGLYEHSHLKAPLKLQDERRVIVYGTSITQGGCASRPGMCYTNILSRRMPYEFINLGFSGNGRGEPELAELIGEIERPGLLVLDYVANAESPEQYRATLPNFIRIYRNRHPKVPILVLSRIAYAADVHDAASIARRASYRDTGQQTVEALRIDGDRHISFFDCTELLADDYEQCTVDGIHPTDLGFMRMANGLQSVFSGMLE